MAIIMTNLICSIENTHWTIMEISFIFSSNTTLIMKNLYQTLPKLTEIMYNVWSLKPILFFCSIEKNTSYEINLLPDVCVCECEIFPIIYRDREKSYFHNMKFPFNLQARKHIKMTRETERGYMKFCLFSYSNYWIITFKYNRF